MPADRRRRQFTLVAAALLGAVFVTAHLGTKTARAAHGAAISTTGNASDTEAAPSLRSSGSWLSALGGTLVQWTEDHAASAAPALDGEFVGEWVLRHPAHPALTLATGRVRAVTRGHAVGGLVTLPDGRAHRVTTSASGRLVLRTAQLSQPRSLHPEKPTDGVAPPPDLEPSLVSHLPKTPRRVVALYTVPALSAAGGDERRIAEGLRLALAHANAAYAERGQALRFELVSVRMTPADEARDGLEALCRDLAVSESRRYGALAAAERLRTGADHVCLIVGRSRSGTDHGFALVPRDRDELTSGRCGFSVVRVHELRAGDPTLAHELSHNLGWLHPERCR